jgi:hypothetical protein
MEIVKADPQIAERLLGECECGIALRYNRYNDPYCERCDGLRIGEVCPGCGRPTKDGVVERDHTWFCVDCGYFRDYEISHFDMGSGAAKPGIRKLYWSCWRWWRRRMRLRRSRLKHR